MGLPGHPVSALVIFSVFGAAILERLSGREPLRHHPAVRAILTRNLPSRSGRTDYVRVKLEHSDGGALAVPVFGRSGMLRTLTEAKGFIVIPVSYTHLKPISPPKSLEEKMPETVQPLPEEKIPAPVEPSPPAEENSLPGELLQEEE